MTDREKIEDNLLDAEKKIRAVADDGREAATLLSAVYLKSIIMILLDLRDQQQESLDIFKSTVGVVDE